MATKALTTAVFDYSLVDKDTKGKLISLSGRLKSVGASWKDAGLKLGEDVHEAHKLLAKERKGLFEKWVDAETAIGLKTAYNLMNVYVCTKQHPILQNLQNSVAYLLAEPKTPREAIEAAENLAAKGEKVTLVKAKELISKFREKVKSAPRKPKTPKPAEAAPPPEPLPPAALVVEGPCPHGGPHDYDDEACKRCHDPKPGTGQPSGGITFNPSEWEPEDVRDCLDNDVPADLEDVFKIIGEFDEQRNKLTSIKSWLTQRIKHPAGKHLEAAVDRIRSDIDQADREIKFCKPYAVCVYCHNKAPKLTDCNACKGLGWITQPIYDAAPKGMKRDKVKS